MLAYEQQDVRIRSAEDSLLEEIAKMLGYKFSANDLKAISFNPQWYSTNVQYWNLSKMIYEVKQNQILFSWVQPMRNDTNMPKKDNMTDVTTVEN